jgi:hypothetical protein
VTQRIAKRVWRALGAIEGFEEGSSIFSDDDAERAWFVDGTQVANLVRGDTLGLRLTRRNISALRARLKADPHIELRRSDWIRIRLDADVNLDWILELAETAAAAHRPPPGVPPRMPPRGADLARRRRFH